MKVFRGRIAFAHAHSCVVFVCLWSRRPFKVLVHPHFLVRPPLPLLLVLSFLSAARVAIAADSIPLPPTVKSFSAPYERFGSVERIDPALDALIAPDARLEKLAEGFRWSEGPVWVSAGDYLLFSDVPENRVYRWDDKKGLAVFHAASGFGGDSYEGKERGSNGLTLDAKGNLVLCQHGDRRVARLNKDGRTFTALADRYEGKRFNSPNDVCFDRRGNLFFTDPPYGLAPNSVREIEFHGVYRVTPKGVVTLLSKELERPNGIALSPDQKTLYVANSHRPNPVIMAYALNADGTAGPGKVFFDMTPHFLEGRKGSADGLKVDVKGNLWATGPGGVLIISPEGRRLGTILAGAATANCGWGDDGKTLYLTSNNTLCRIRTKVQGIRPD